MARRTNAIYYPSSGLRLRGRAVLPAGAATNATWGAPTGQPLIGMVMATSSLRGVVGINARPVAARRLTLG